MVLQHFVMYVPQHREGIHVCALRAARAPVPQLAIGAEAFKCSSFRFCIVWTVAALAAPTTSEALNLSSGQLGGTCFRLGGILIASKSAECEV